MRFWDRFLKLVIARPHLFLQDIPATLGILGFIFSGISDPSDTFVWFCVGVGVVVLVGYWLIRAHTALIDLYAARFLNTVSDEYVSVLLTSADDSQLHDYLRTTYPEWYIQELPATIRQLSSTSLPNPQACDKR